MDIILRATLISIIIIIIYWWWRQQNPFNSFHICEFVSGKVWFFFHILSLRSSYADGGWLDAALVGVCNLINWNWTALTMHHEIKAMWPIAFCGCSSLFFYLFSGVLYDYCCLLSLRICSWMLFFNFNKRTKQKVDGKANYNYNNSKFSGMMWRNRRRSTESRIHNK